MLGVYSELFESLQAAGISYCSWKNNHELTDCLGGKGDLDLLVDHSMRSEFETILEQAGFKEPFFPHIRYENICHFYGLDRQTGQIVHLHVYYELRTGESHLKNFHLPFEAAILGRLATSESGVPIPSPDWQLGLFLLRYFIKNSSIPGALLYFKERNDYRRELDFITSQFEGGRPELPREIQELVDIDLIKAWDKRSVWRTYFIGSKLRRQLKPFNIYSSLEELWQRYLQIVRRAYKKIFVRQKKVWNKGAILAITGLDGAGKSTMIGMADQWLSPHFHVVTLHVGRPPATALTLWSRFFLYIRKVNERRNKKNRPASSQTVKSTGLIWAIRFALLAYERYRLLRYAEKQVRQGRLILCDRYPSLSRGKMDSPRIEVNEKSGRLVKYLAQLEQRWYSMMPEPDLLLHLTVPLELALERNRNRVKVDRETDAELGMRYGDNKDLRYAAKQFEEINNDMPEEDSVLLVKNKLWVALPEH